jgi:ribosome biogenesis GTPase
VEGKCRYTKCTHTKEEGCNIIERVKTGEISKTRHNSYVALFTILKAKPRWKK